MKLEKRIFRSFSKILTIFSVIALIGINIIMVTYVQIYAKMDLDRSVYKFNYYMSTINIEEFKDEDVSILLEIIKVMPTTKIVIIEDNQFIYDTNDPTVINDDTINNMLESKYFNTFIYDGYLYNYIEIENTNDLVSGQVYLIHKDVWLFNISVLINFLCLLSFILLLLLGLVYCKKTSKHISKPLVKFSEMIPLINENNIILFDEDTKITEISKLSKELNISSARIVEKSAENQKNISNISHELRTPLMKIKGYAEGMKYDVIEVQEAAQIIIEQSDKLTDTMEKVLQITRFENCKYIFKRADIGKILQNLINTYRGVRISKNKSINFEFEKNLMVYLNDELLENVVNNIITNALRYCKQNIDIKVFEQEGSCVIILKDDGDGIYDIDNCFNRYEKGEDGKFGLGLNIVYESMKLMNGSVHVENENGAIFTIKMPLDSNKYKD